MTSRQPVPVTVLAGSDAAGLADRVVAAGECIVAESWYGPGSIRVDADVAHRTPGCACCAMRLDAIDGLLRAVRRAHPPTRVYFVAGPQDDVATIVYTILSDADLTRHVRLDGVVVALDAVATSTRIAAGGALGAPVELDALAIADVMVLERSEELTSEGLVRLRRGLRGLNAVGSQLVAAGRHPSDRRDGLRKVVDLDAWHGAPAIDPSVTVLRPAGEAPDTVVLRQSAPLDPGAVDAWLDRLVETHAQRLLRMQGALAVESAPARVCCHGVRSYAMSHSEVADPVTSRRNQSLVVLVGHGLDVEELTAGFAATRVR